MWQELLQSGIGNLLKSGAVVSAKWVEHLVKSGTALLESEAVTTN